MYLIHTFYINIIIFIDVNKIRYNWLISGKNMVAVVAGKLVEQI